MVAWVARLADRATGSGSVLATDIGISGLSGLHRANLTVARHDLEREEVPAGEYDLIHARLVLEHLREPAAAVAKLASALRAGGGSSWKTPMACCSTPSPPRRPSR